MSKIFTITRVCKRCSAEFLIRSSRQMYCDECGPVNQKETFQKWKKDNPEKAQQYLKNRRPSIYGHTIPTGVLPVAGRALREQAIRRTKKHLEYLKGQRKLQGRTLEDEVTMTALMRDGSSSLAALVAREEDILRTLQSSYADYMGGKQ